MNMGYEFIYSPWNSFPQWHIKIAVLPIREGPDYRPDLKRLMDDEIKIEHYRLFAKSSDSSYRLIAILLPDQQFLKREQRRDFEADVERFLAQSSAFDPEKMVLIDPLSTLSKESGMLNEVLGTNEIYVRRNADSSITRQLLNRKYGEMFLGGATNLDQKAVLDLRRESYGY